MALPQYDNAKDVGIMQKGAAEMLTCHKQDSQQFVRVGQDGFRGSGTCSMQNCALETRDSHQSMLP